MVGWRELNKVDLGGVCCGGSGGVLGGRNASVSVEEGGNASVTDERGGTGSAWNGWEWLVRYLMEATDTAGASLKASLLSSV